MYIALVIFLLLMPIPLYVGYRSSFENKQHRKYLLAVKEGLKRLIKRHGLSIYLHDGYGKPIAIDRNMNNLVLVPYRNGITWVHRRQVQVQSR